MNLEGSSNWRSSTAVFGFVLKNGCQYPSDNISPGLSLFKMMNRTFTVREAAAFIGEKLPGFSFNCRMTKFR